MCVARTPYACERMLGTCVKDWSQRAHARGRVPVSALPCGGERSVRCVCACCMRWNVIDQYSVLYLAHCELHKISARLNYIAQTERPVRRHRARLLPLLGDTVSRCSV